MPTAAQRPLKLPTNPARVRATNKALFNEARSIENADFYTVGYEGRTTGQLFQILCSAGVQSIVDIRHTPLSRFRPELSKTNLRKLAQKRGLSYYHLREWGVPHDIRAKALGAKTRGAIWEWYDEAVVDRFFQKNLHWFLNLEHPVALMCVEADPTECHRHRIFDALEQHGLRGFDL